MLFLDTPDFRFYNNAFILRRRILYEDGFPIGDPEIVFKFRHPDMQMAAETDVRPRIFGDYRIKFKAEALPLKDRLGGIRLLFSHNVQFPVSATCSESNPTSLDTLVDVFPALEPLKKSSGARRSSWSATRSSRRCCRTSACSTSGKGSRPRRTWRSGARGATTGRSSASSPSSSSSSGGEDLREKAMRRAEAFFLALQYAAKDWIALGATKTGVVYRLKGNPPHAHE